MLINNKIYMNKGDTVVGVQGGLTDRPTCLVNWPVEWVCILVTCPPMASCVVRGIPGEGR